MATSGNTTLTSSVPIFSLTESYGDMYELIHGATVGRCVITFVVSTTVANIRVVEPFGGTSAICRIKRMGI